MINRFFFTTGSLEAVPTAIELIPTPAEATAGLLGKAPTSGSGDFCLFKGKKYGINEKIEDGCESICKCVVSPATIECEPRCPKMNHTITHEQCVTVPDPKDLCCHIELCDVTLDDHEQGSAIAIVPAPPSFDAMKIKKGNHTTNLLSSDYKERKSTTSSAIPAIKYDSNEKRDCEHNGNKYEIGTTKLNCPPLFRFQVFRFYKIVSISGQQFNEGCESLCICMAEGIHCEKIECPSTFGLEIMDPHCLEWAPEPATFRAIVPKCCPGIKLIEILFYFILFRAYFVMNLSATTEFII